MTILMLAAVVSVLVWGLYEHRLASEADVFSRLPLILDIKDRDAEWFGHREVPTDGPDGGRVVTGSGRS
jgi:hypothetical protein